jgi:hypothetical protein
VDLSQIAVALLGAVVGAGGALVAGVVLQRREGTRRARNAARALWFELRSNEVCVLLARDHGQFLPLSRTTYERLLPDLAGWLRLDELETVAAPYQGHAGYDQAWHDASLPPALRGEILARLVKAHDEATRLLGARVA